jgi:hypothetical protein
MKINNREVLFVEHSSGRNWAEELPDYNWLCILVDDDQPRNIVEAVLSRIIDHNVCYVCAVGQASEMNHDLLDEEIVYRDVDIDKPYLPKHEIITTWHTDFEEGIWFAVFATNHSETSIEKIVVLDLTGGRETERIEKLMKGFPGPPTSK